MAERRRSQNIHDEYSLHYPLESYQDYADPLHPKAKTSTRSITVYPNQYPGQRYGAFESQRSAVAVHTYEAGAAHEKHAHPDLEQTYYIIAGRATVTVGDETATIGPGGSAYIPPGVNHGFAVAGDQTLVLLTSSSRLV